MRVLFHTGVAALTVVAQTVFGGVVWLDWSTDREPVSYSVGETVTFRVRLVEDGKPLAGKILKWARSGDDQAAERGEALTAGDGSAEIRTPIRAPGFVRMEVW
ncbi:MAG: hypothetical protein RBT78_13740, partial [Kiritimatiellia bacterium]|nr:hypothetical protein [Kiritimatiellia bacterium]